MKNIQINEFYEMTYKGEKVMCITHTPSGKKAVFDNAPNILNRVLEETKMRRNALVPKKDYPVLVFPKSRQGISYSSLASVVYSEYHNIPLEDLRKYHIRHIESGDIEDCRSCNLYSTGTIAPETAAVKFDFTNDNRYFELLLKKTNTRIVFDNNDDLFELLATPHYTIPFMNRYRPQARINGISTGKNRCSPYLSVIAYACYNQGLTVDNHLQKIPEIMTYSHDNNLQVEHLNGNVFDNRRYNLTLVNGSLNLAKKDLMKYICNPYICNVVLGTDNRFRMILGKAERVEDLLNSKLIILDTFDDVVTVLKAYKKTYPALFENNTTHLQYLFREPIVSETLSTMPDNYFISYKNWLSAYEDHTTEKERVAF